MDNQSEKKEGEQNFNIFGKKIKKKTTLLVLSYLGVFSIIPLLISKDNFIKFHAKQGLVLFFISLLVSLIVWIPVIGQILALILVLVNVIAIIKALNGEKWKIPYIYQWAQKIKV